MQHEEMVEDNMSEKLWKRLVLLPTSQPLPLLRCPVVGYVGEWIKEIKEV